MSAASLGALSASAPAPMEPTPKTVKDAAAQFEALLLQQMLRSAREAGDSNSDDQAAASMKEYAEQNLAQLLARNGGIGLGSLLARGLAPRGTEAPISARIGAEHQRQ